MPKRDIPFLLRRVEIVAYFFFLAGGWALLNVIWLLVHGRIHIDFTVLAVLIGRGLLSRNRTSLKWALFCAYVSMIMSVIGFCYFLLILFADGLPPLFEASYWISYSLVIGAISAWTCNVLTDPETQRLFPEKPMH